MNEKGNRVNSLDALRGLAIFGMILSGEIPWKGLPHWMYHAQVPPPDHIFNPNIPGISWVDLVFPFFLFSMGAAIPWAQSRRIEKGEPLWQILGHIIFRGLILAAFAIYLGNSSPWSVSDHPDMRIWLRTVFGFICWLLMLVRWPFDDPTKKGIRYTARAIGVLGILWLMSTVVWKDGSGFSKERNDIIIRLLAFGYTVSSIVWLISRENLMLRLAIIAGVFAFRLHTAGGGHIISTLDKWFEPIHFIFAPNWIQLTLVILPGTIIGDLLLKWSRQKDKDSLGLGLPPSYITLILLSTFALVPGGLYFLYTRFVFSGLIFTLALCPFVWCLLRQSETPKGTLLQTIFNWGIFFLVLGYILEPYEGGIKKDPATPAYYFVSVGMAISLLVFFYILIDALQKGWSVGFLRVVGSNPMLAYIMGGYFAFPLMHITGIIHPIDRFIGDDLTLSTAWAFCLTFIACGFTYLFSRFRLFLRV